MSISLPSDVTVALLWGDRWMVSGLPGPIVFGEIGRAAKTLLGHFGERGRPGRLRLLFQPPGLVSVAVDCPNGNRATLQAALQPEHPVVADPARAWSHEPIIGGTTLLHFERAPSLFGLVAELQARGVAVEGAWPLASALVLLPEESPDIVALTVVAVAGGQTLVVRYTPAGSREVETAGGEQAGVLLQSTMRRVREAGDCSLSLVTLDDAGARLREQFAQHEDAGNGHLHWEDLVGVARILPAAHPGQLLPRRARLDARRVVAGVSALALAAAGVFGFLTVRETAALRAAAAHEAVAVGRLRSEVAALRRNQAEVQQLRAELAAARPGRIACAALMRTVTRELPPQVVLTTLHADRDGFRVAGGVSGSGLTGKAWEHWLDQLKTPGVDWELVPPVPVPPAAEFTLKGVWR